MLVMYVIINDEVGLKICIVVKQTKAIENE